MLMFYEYRKINDKFKLYKLHAKRYVHTTKSTKIGLKRISKHILDISHEVMKFDIFFYASLSMRRN